MNLDCIAPMMDVVILQRHLSPFELNSFKPTLSRHFDTHDHLDRCVQYIVHTNTLRLGSHWSARGCK